MVYNILLQNKYRNVLLHKFKLILEKWSDQCTVYLEETKMFLYVKPELKINGKETFGKYSEICTFPFGFTLFPFCLYG